MKNQQTFKRGATRAALRAGGQVRSKFPSATLFPPGRLWLAPHAAQGITPAAGRGHSCPPRSDFRGVVQLAARGRAREH